MPDLSVRNVPDGVIDRLREQAASEGVSVSEWVRTALAERAELPTTAELAARRAARSGAAQSPEAFAAFYDQRLRRRGA